MAKWQNSAACRAEVDDSIWFPADRADIVLAKFICARCPVRAECLRDALANEGGRTGEYRHGIRGGMTPEERAHEYRRLVRLARKLVAA
jgi:WhiB family redox-sensing transcriptional regulator